MVEHFKLQQHFSKFVVVLNDLLGFAALQDLGVLLESIHWLLDAVEQLTRPRYLSCQGKESMKHRTTDMTTLSFLSGEGVNETQNN